MSESTRGVEANKAILHRAVEEIWNRNNLNAADELVAENFVDHTPLPGQLPGRDGFKQVVRTIHGAFPDIQETIEDLVAEGDKVVLRVLMKGTHINPFMGIESTNKRIEISGMAIVRIVDGKIAERWSISDDFSLFIELGAVYLKEEFSPRVLPFSSSK